jgi:hypothetical protein
MSDLYNVTPRQASKMMERIVRSGLVPNLNSSPGMGKSSLVRILAKKLNLKLIDHRLSTSDPTDLSGLPFRAPGDLKATFLPYDLFPLEGDTLPEGKDGWMVFLDEFNAAPRSVQAAAYKLILDREVGQYKLHPNTIIILAGNLATDRAIVNDLSTAMQSRVIHLVMTASFTEWEEDVAFKQNYDARIIAYLNANKDLLHNFRPDHNEKTFPCPRTWEFMNQLCKTTPVEEMEEYTPMFAGAVGAGTAAGFIQFSQVFMDLPKISDIRRDPEHTFIPTNSATRWAIASTLIQETDEKSFKPFSEYVNRMPMEFRVLYLRAVMQNKPELRQLPEFATAAVTLSQYLHSGPTI